MRFAFGLALLLLVAVPVNAQDEGIPDLPRPKLAAGADTNDARFLALAARGAKSPDEAYGAFLWAHRLKPTRLDYLEGMVNALLARNSFIWQLRYYLGDPSVQGTPLAMQIDSVRREMDYLDPFYGLPGLRGTCQPATAPSAPRNRRRPLTTKEEAQQFVERGYRSLRAGCYYRVLEELAEAVQRDSMLEHHLLLRAFALYKLQRQEEAAVDMQRAIGGARRLQAQSIEQSLYTTAMLEYVSGMMSRSIGDGISARRAFERALAEDLSFYPAHVRLGELAMRRGDLAGALESLSLATQIRPDNGLALAAYAQALVAGESYGEAASAYVKAIERLPHYADLRFALAELYDRSNDTSAAVGAYGEYVARSARADSLQVQFATERMRSLQAGSR